MDHRGVLSGHQTYWVPDEERAHRFAEALAQHGFALVSGRPSAVAGEDRRWMVTAFDEGPYPDGAAGQRTLKSVFREAAAIGERFGARPSSYGWGEPKPLPTPIRYENRGSRPAVAVVVMREPPPAADLADGPAVAEPPDLTGLDEVDWAQIEHADGLADIAPTIRQLATDCDDWDGLFEDMFYVTLFHQETCCSATEAVVPFAGRLMSLPMPRRLAVADWLVRVARMDHCSLLAVGSHDWWTPEVRNAVGRILPELLARWEAEPPVIRFRLAALAGLFPEHGRQVEAQVSAMAEELAGTREGAYLELAVALTRGTAEHALTLARGIVEWEQDVMAEWLDVDQDARVKATYVLLNSCA